MVEALYNKLVVNALYYARITDKVEFYRPTSLEEFENQPADWPYRVTQCGGERHVVMVEYRGNRLDMPFVTPKEAVRLFETGVRPLADIAATVEEANG